MAVIACIVIAFAQPFIPGSNVATQEKETAIYLDNSYSMQSSGSKGELFKTAVTDLLERLPNDQKFTLFTNSNTYTNTTKKEVANDLLNSEYQSKPLSYEQIQLKANALLNDNKKRKELIIISDFQKIDETFPDTIKGLKRELVFLEAEGSNNISIDTAYISRRETNSIDISVSVTSDKAINNPVTLSLENNDVLVAKTSVDLTNLKDTGIFNFETSQPLQGRIYLEDNSLSFDNELFISNNIDRKIKVLAINTVDGDFLKRIYTEDEFDFTAVRSRDLNFNLLKEQNLIILNEINSISVNLAKEINTYLRNGGYLVMIPALDQSGYSSINNIQGTDNISEKEKRITEINYNHPLLKGVFNKQISNFQYPKVNATTNTISALNPILKFEDGSSFLFQKGNVFNFTAPLNNQNSNFKNSPLIVPILYNMGRNSLPVQQLYYHIGDKNSIAIPEKIIRDEILELRNESNAIIPKQRAFESFVLIEIEDELNNSGNYKVIKDNESITTLSFNSSRQENKLNYFTASELGSNNIAYSVEDLVYKLNEEDGVLSLWRYFVIGALFFLICELLILKFLK